MSGPFVRIGGIRRSTADTFRARVGTDPHGDCVALDPGDALPELTIGRTRGEAESTRIGTVRTPADHRRPGGLIVAPGGLESVRAVLAAVGEDGQGSWDKVCVACAEVPSMTGAGIILSAGGEIRTSLGKSDPVEGVIEEAQFTLGEGPCIDAARQSAPVHEPDLAGPGVLRWPVFSPRAVAAGVAAVFAMPLQVGATHLGAMNYYRTSPGPLTHQQITQVLGISDLVAHTLIALQADAPPGALAPALVDVPFRTHVHQATGMISAQLDIDMAEALVRLRAFAYTQDRPIDDVAGQVVVRTLRFDGQSD